MDVSSGSPISPSGVPQGASGRTSPHRFSSTEVIVPPPVLIHHFAGHQHAQLTRVSLACLSGPALYQLMLVRAITLEVHCFRDFLIGRENACGCPMQPSLRAPQVRPALVEPIALVVRFAVLL